MVKNKKPKSPSSGSTQHSFVRVDLSFPGFKAQLAELPKEALAEVLDTVTKVQKMTWQDIWNTSTKGRGKRGLNWEKLDQSTDAGHPIASIRITKKHRARVCREQDWMRFISLHPDHDSAY